MHIISRPPSEIFFSYILRLQDFDTAFKLEKIFMTKVVVWKKKKERKKKKNIINLSSAEFFQGATKVIFLTRRSTVHMLKAISGKGQVVYYTVIHNARLLQLVPLNDHKRKQNNLSLKNLLFTGLKE